MNTNLSTIANFQRWISLNSSPAYLLFYNWPSTFSVVGERRDFCFNVQIFLSCEGCGESHSKHIDTGMKGGIWMICFVLDCDFFISWRNRMEWDAKTSTNHLIGTIWMISGCFGCKKLSTCASSLQLPDYYGIPVTRVIIVHLKNKSWSLIKWEHTQTRDISC